LNVEVKGQGHQRQKNEKVRHFVWESSSAVRYSANFMQVGKSAHAVYLVHSFVEFIAFSALTLLAWRQKERPAS